MKRVSAVLRVTIGLTLLTLSIILAAQMLNLVPSSRKQALRHRQDLCEALAIQCSLAAERHDYESLRESIVALSARQQDLISVAVRLHDGTVLAEIGDPGDDTAGTRITVPIHQGDQAWGVVEVSFAPFGGGGWRGVLSNPTFHLIAFIAIMSFVSFRLYLKRTLAHLDPAAVIPERVKTMLDTLAEGVMVVDLSERILLANNAFATLVGMSSSDLLGRKASALPWTSLDRPDEPVNPPWSMAMETAAPLTGVPLGLRAADGSDVRRTIVVNCSPIIGGDKLVRGGMATFDDVTHIEQKNAELNEALGILRQSRDEIDRKNRELEVLATIDPLTGCLNRRSFYEQFTGRWSAAKRYGHQVSVLLMDVDHFKRINDTYGHSIGDQVLQQVAQKLRDLSRAGDLVCRYGGEEFCIMLDHAGIEEAAKAAERYRRGLEGSECGPARLTASVGVTSMELAARDVQALMDQADRALYSAKRSGRNRSVRFDQMPEDPVLATGGDRSQPDTLPRGPVGEIGAPIPYRTVTALHSALANRDAATAQHATRVAELCVRLGRQLLSPTECFTLEVAALLHDIGKLGVPDAILLKPGPLDVREWQVMRSHDRMGTEIVAALASTELTHIVANHHARYAETQANHERFGATPVPVGARILGIADAFDAMVSDRPYRRGRTPQEAFAELRRCSGTQFDPELVEKFIAVMSGESVIRLSPDQVSSVESDGVAARIGMELEGLTAAVAAGQVQTLTETSTRLARIAADAGLGELERTARRVQGASHGDLSACMDAAQELLALCRQAAERQAPTPNMAAA